MRASHLSPNLVVAKDWKSGATTNPEICAAVIEYFFDRGYRNVFVLESAWIGCDTQRAFKVCGYTALAEKYGIELVDVKKDRYESREYGGMRIDISKRALEADCLINLPLIKGHCQTRVTCALKNLKGLISDREKRRFHVLGLHQPIAYLNKIIRPALTIADGIYTDPGFEEGGNPVRMNTMVAGTDSVLVDAYAAKRLGYDACEIGYIGIAERIGVGSADLGNAEIVRVTGAQPQPDRARSKALDAARAHIDEREACSACVGNLLSALAALEESGGCGDLRVCVGQGFRDRTGDIGCGDCTRRFAHSIRGCPPDAEKIKQELRNIRRNL